MTDTITLGTCSECGGRVVLPAVTVPTEPRRRPWCQGCGAVHIAPEHGPVIRMTPRAPRLLSVRHSGAADGVVRAFGSGE